MVFVNLAVKNLISFVVLRSVMKVLTGVFGFRARLPNGLIYHRISIKVNIKELHLELQRCQRLYALSFITINKWALKM